MMNSKNDIESLIVKYLNGTITMPERNTLVSWINESDEHQRTFDQVREIWLVSEMNNKSYGFDYKEPLSRFNEKVQQKEKSPLRKSKQNHVITLSYGWAAAIILMAIFSGAILFNIIKPESTLDIADKYQEIKVPYGSRSNILLPDGSEITLNAGTTLRYNVDFGKNSRDLWLDGEAYFIVNKSSTPFIVHSGTVKIKALGTQFNVRGYSSENKIETTLVEGKVSINKINNDDEQAVEDILLLPNQKLIVANDGLPDKNNIITTVPDPTSAEPEEKAQASQIIKKENVDPLPDISWKDKEWIIYRESLADLSVKIERRFDVTVVFKDEHLKSFRYNGTLPDESLEQVLTIMAMVSPINYSVKGKTVTFSENKAFDLE